MDPPYARWNVIYVGFVAFLPYPICLIGTYFRNPLSLALLALNLAAVSSMEALLFAHAWRADLLIEEPSRAGYRWILLMSLLPVPVFLLSIPVAFASSTGVALASWLLAPALQAIAIRRRPADVADF
jgi:TMEM175 potassium channel family protein